VTSGGQSTARVSERFEFQAKLPSGCFGKGSLDLISLGRNACSWQLYHEVFQLRISEIETETQGAGEMEHATNRRWAGHWHHHSIGGHCGCGLHSVLEFISEPGKPDALLPWQQWLGGAKIESQNRWA